jgi:hypothetical protein
MFTAIVSMFRATPALGSGQAPATGAMRQSAFETLKDSQWVQMASSELGRREGRLLQRSPTELILSPEPQPLRIPATTIDTLWTRGHSAKTGAIVGAAFFAVSLGGGTLAGGLVGMLIGTTLPRWNRRFP